MLYLVVNRDVHNIASAVQRLIHNFIYLLKRQHDYTQKMNVKT